MPLPPARYTSRTFTLATAPAYEVALVHGNWKRHQRFWTIAYGQRPVSVWNVSCDGSLAGAVLLAKELDGIPLASWDLFEPPPGVKLFSPTDPLWARRRHRRARQALLRLYSHRTDESARPCSRLVLSGHARFGSACVGFTTSPTVVRASLPG